MASQAAGRTASKTVTDTIVGEHTHTIVGYSLIKGIGDGEPVASERFAVGGHEWVLLFYPDGKRSSTEGLLGNPGAEGHGGAVALPPGIAGVPPLAAALRGEDPLDAGAGLGAAPGAAAAAAGGEGRGGGGAAAAAAAAGGAAGDVPPAVGHPGALLAAQHPHGVVAQLQGLGLHRAQRRDTTNEYAALFVALIGEGPNPQGIVSTTEGKVVRAFHRFTLVDQTGQGRDLTKGRTRDAGAVKISCARQDPNARNCHGYRKFVKRSLLEDPSKGYLANDTIVIRYTIELVVSSGGALMRNAASGPGRCSASELIRVPPPSLGADMAALLRNEDSCDVVLHVGGEEIKAHKWLLQARSRYFEALLAPGGMREGREGRAEVHGIEPPVFRALLHFLYTDSLPEGMDSGEGGPGLDVSLAQHLLAAADLLQLERLRRIAERRLVEGVDTDSVAYTLALADKNHAEELKRVCLDYVARNLAAVLHTDGYRHMLASCPHLQGELLGTVAALGGPGGAGGGGGGGGAGGGGGGGGGGYGGGPGSGGGPSPGAHSVPEGVPPTPVGGAGQGPGQMALAVRHGHGNGHMHNHGHVHGHPHGGRGAGGGAGNGHGGNGHGGNGHGGNGHGGNGGAAVVAGGGLGGGAGGPALGAGAGGAGGAGGGRLRDGADDEGRRVRPRRD